MLEVRIYEPGWNDRRWTKALRKLDAKQRERLEEALVALARDLAACKHPHLDPSLQRWSPTRWHAPKKKPGTWYEYRLGDRKNAARVIACHDHQNRVLYLVARTVTHDHRRLDRIVRDF